MLQRQKNWSAQATYSTDKLYTLSAHSSTVTNILTVRRELLDDYIRSQTNKAGLYRKTG